MHLDLRYHQADQCYQPGREVLGVQPLLRAPEVQGLL